MDNNDINSIDKVCARLFEMRNERKNIELEFLKRAFREFAEKYHTNIIQFEGFGVNYIGTDYDEPKDACIKLIEFDDDYNVVNMLMYLYYEGVEKEDCNLHNIGSENYLWLAQSIVSQIINKKWVDNDVLDDYTPKFHKYTNKLTDREKSLIVYALEYLGYEENDNETIKAMMYAAKNVELNENN